MFFANNHLPRSRGLNPKSPQSVDNVRVGNEEVGASPSADGLAPTGRALWVKLDGVLERMGHRGDRP